MSQTVQQESEYLPAKALAARLGMGQSTLWRKVKEEQLPGPDFKLGQRCTRWNWANVVAYLEQRKQGAA